MLAQPARVGALEHTGGQEHRDEDERGEHRPRADPRRGRGEGGDRGGREDQCESSVHVRSRRATTCWVGRAAREPRRQLGQREAQHDALADLRGADDGASALRALGDRGREHAVARTRAR